MFRKVIATFVVAVFCVGIALAEDVSGVVKKFDGNKFSIQKTKFNKDTKKLENDGEPIAATIADNCKVVKGKFNKDTKKLEAGDAIEGGLKNELFTKIDAEKGIRIVATIDGGKCTQIIVGGGKGK